MILFLKGGISASLGYYTPVEGNFNRIGMRDMRSIARNMILAGTLLLLAGCGPVISKDTLGRIDRTLTFEEVIKDPGAYAGRTIVLGGTILAVENLDGRTIAEVIEQDMNSRLKPVRPESSAGRFLIEFDGFKDPALYNRGKSVSVAGTITGVEKRMLGKAEYAYPVIRPVEHYLWEEERGPSEPRIGLGLGLGFGF